MLRAEFIDYVKNFSVEYSLEKPRVRGGVGLEICSLWTRKTSRIVPQQKSTNINKRGGRKGIAWAIYPITLFSLRKGSIQQEGHHLNLPPTKKESNLLRGSDHEREKDEDDHFRV